MDGFEKKESPEANGGDVTKGTPINMSTSEYNRQQGSDGFSKTGGAGNGFSK